MKIGYGALDDPLDDKVVPPDTVEEIVVKYETTPPETELLDKIPVPLAIVVEFDSGY